MRPRHFSLGNKDLRASTKAQEKLMEKEPQLCSDQTNITHIQNILEYAVTWPPNVKSRIPGISIVSPHIFPGFYCANER